MSFNKSPLAFDDIRAIFEKALNSEHGLRIPCRSRAAAVVLRSRFNYFRVQDREFNKNTYDPDHLMHGRSMYDKFVLRLPYQGAPDDHVLYIQPRAIGDMTVEELGPEDGPSVRDDEKNSQEPTQGS